MARSVVQAMDLSQALQTIKWMDEERRKDGNTIAALEGRAETHEALLSDLSTQIANLEGRLTGVQKLSAQVSEFEQAVSNFKNEMVFLLNQREEQWNKERAEAARLRRLEFETLSEQLSQLDRKRLEGLPRYNDALRARQTEDQRLNELLQQLEVTVGDLSQRTEERLQAVPYLEEQRRADSRRIGELTQDANDLRRKLDDAIARIPRLTEMIQKLEPRIEQVMEEARKYDKPMEDLRASDFQREQKMKQYLDQGEQVAQELERIRVHTQGFFEQQQLVKRALEKLESFQPRLEKRQNEVAEMQRVSEERLGRQWKEWQDEEAKKQQKEAIISEERWRRQEEANETYLALVSEIRPSVELYREQLDSLWEARRADAVRAIRAVQDEYEEPVAQADAHLSILRGGQ